MYWAKYHGKDQVTIFDFASMESFNGEERMRKAAELAYHNTAQTLAIALDERDERTKDHATNVATLAEIFSSRLTLSRHKIDMIRMAAMVHDIGKLGMMNLANKEPEELTEEETVYLQQHPILCHEILTATDLGVVVPWVAAHHERWDGGGYPNGLEGQQIPYESRIIALCDVYENLTGQRRRGVPLSHNEAMAMIIKERGRRFDPDLTDSFVHLMNLLNQMAYDEPVGRLTFSDDPVEVKPGSDSFYTLVRAKLR
jgi:putative two-component system response regulator